MSSSSAATNLESETDVRGGGSGPPDRAQAPIFVSWKKAFRRKELYLLWVTRLSVVLITQVIANIYKTFGQTFIYDDHFLSTVGSVSSFFNCSGRLLYGLIMDKTSYKVGMSIEAIFLTLLMSTFYLTSLVGNPTAMPATIASNQVCDQINNLQHPVPLADTFDLSSILNVTSGEDQAFLSSFGGSLDAARE